MPVVFAVFRLTASEHRRTDLKVVKY